MTINILAPATRLITVLEGLSGLTAAQIGAPASIGPQLTAWIGLGSYSPVRKITGITQQEVHYFVCFCYRVDESESTAETTLLGLIPAFDAALHADLTLNGTVLSLTLNSLTADEPEYQLRAGKEYREYPMVVAAKLQGSFTTNP